MSGTSSRGNPSMGDILRSVIVLALVLLVLFGIGRLLTVTPDGPPRVVDYQSAAESSRTIADFDLLAPQSLPADWNATSVRFEDGTWHLGVLTDDQEYIGLEQVRLGEKAAVERFAAESTPDGSIVIEGTTWSRRSAPDGDTTYLRMDAAMTVLVTGSASPEVIERYISSLSSS